MITYLILSLSFNIVLCSKSASVEVFRRGFFCNNKDKKTNHSLCRPSDFSYGDSVAGPDNWPAMFGTCDGENQSPINIDMSELRRLKVPRLDWSSAYFNTPKCMTLTHSGHRLILKAKYPFDCQPKLSFGPLLKTYTFSAIDFHWGTINSKGSEHTLDEFAYPMEMHVFHNLETDVCNSSTVIIAYFFQIGEKTCSSINKILEVFNKALRRPNRPVSLKHSFSLSSLLYAFSSEYIVYEGSLTYPPCTEDIKWIVYPYPLEISVKQLGRFRTVSKHAPDLVNNYRPVQALNNRAVYFVS